MTKPEMYRHAIISLIIAANGDITDQDFETLDMLFETYRAEKDYSDWEANSNVSGMPSDTLQR